ADLRGVGPDIAVHGTDVAVAGDRPEAGAVELGVPVHGVVLAQGGERLVRDGLDERVVVGEVDELGDLGHGLPPQRWCRYSSISQSETHARWRSISNRLTARNVSTISGPSASPRTASASSASSAASSEAGSSAPDSSR